MAQYKITKPINWGPYTIGDKNYGPQCPSCKVPINNYAPQVGQIVEGDLENATYYVYYNNQKHLTTGAGIRFPIYTNGAASTQAQSTIQFIPQDHIEPYTPPAPPVDPELPVQNEPPISTPDKPENEVGKTVCFLCENRGPVVVGLFLLVLLVVLLNQSGK